MSKRLLLSQWKTERLNVKDSILDEVPGLQKINDAVPQTQGWMVVEGQDVVDCSMLSAFQNGVLPPVPNRSKAYFRLQSIRLTNSDELIGFLGVYHGFPQANVFWINTLTFHPDFQRQGYGSELLNGLIQIVKELESYTCMRSYVAHNNLPSLRMCVKVGFNKMLEIAGEQISSENTEVHILLEKTIRES